MTAAPTSCLRRAGAWWRRQDDFRLLLAVLFGAGAIARLALAFATEGSKWDLQSFELVTRALASDPLHLYDVANLNNPPAYRFPYPPGYLPFLASAGVVSKVTGLAFTSVLRVNPIAADIAIAWLVQDFLGRRGFGQVPRLLGAALVLLGPTFVLVSAFNGHSDSLAIVFPAIGFVVWVRSDAEWRGWVAGALIGAGATIKTVPCLMVLALLPTARSWREGAKLIVAAAAVPLVTTAPWLLFGGPGKWAMIRYSGIPGLGSLTLLVDPGSAPAAFGDHHRSYTDLALQVWRRGQLITGGAIVGLAAFLWRYRPRPATAALLVWFTLATFAVTFTPAYYIWILTFVLLVGHLRAGLVLSSVLVAPTLTAFWARAAHKPPAWVVDVFYSGPMIALWAAGVLALIWLGRRTVRERAAASGVAPGKRAGPGG